MTENIGADRDMREASPPHLEMRAIYKSFAGVCALDGVSLNVRAGRVHALLGENGAGKSTLIKILAGAYQADSGSILIQDQEVNLRTPQDAIHAGVATIYQELLLCPNLSIAANVFLGQEHRRRGLGLKESSMSDASKMRLASLGLNVDPRRSVGSLPVAQQQLVEIARALTRDSSVLVMDEPTAALTEPEIERLFGVIRQLRDEGHAIVYISHRLAEIFAIADEVTVMRDGKVITTVPVVDSTEQSLITAMVGRAVGTPQRTERYATPDKPPILAVRHLTRKGAFQDVSLDVRPGEVVGIAGIVGAGRTELLRTIFGLDRADSGRIEIDGHLVKVTSPRVAIRHGMAMTTEDRQKDALFPNFRVRENLTIAGITQLCRLGVIRRPAEQRAASEVSRAFAIRPSDPERLMLYLSGGNQQKVTIGRWLLTEPHVLLLDEPTRGVDVGAKSEIRRIIRERASTGSAVLVVSSELPELLAVTDRLLIMRQGRIVAEVATADTNQEEVMAYAAGTSSNIPGIETP